jgi:hypothetical protein
VRHQLVRLAVIAALTGIALGGLGSLDAASTPAPARAASKAERKASASFAPTTAPKQASETAKTAVVPAALQRILASWRTRGQRTKSFFYGWDEEITSGKAAEDRAKATASAKQADAKARIFHIDFWAEGPNRLRRDSFLLRAPEPVAATLPARTQSVFDGTTEFNLEEPGEAAGPPILTIEKGRGSGPANALRMQVLALTFDPINAFVTNRQSPQFRLVHENVLVDGSRCVEIQNAKDGAALREQCWVDPARDNVIVAYELRFRGEARTRISIQYQRDRVGWLPTGWTLKQSGQFTESTVTKFTINERFPADTFNVKLSPGTVVFDQLGLQQYLVAKDGSKSNVVKFDSARALAVQKMLDTKTDFRLAPQPLREVIDFIEARYQIPIVLLRTDFEAAGLPVSLQVKSPPAGITVAQFLKLLLDQCHHPVGFRIEDEVLKISPKFAGQGLIQAKHVSAAEELDTRAAREIEKTLEIPVNFIVEPQSLRDAVNWIAARHQIRIALDPSIRSTISVKANAPGIRLRSLLSILLEQYPRPLGLKIEGEVLKILPKSVNPESPAAKPTSNSDASKKDLATQRALENKTEVLIGPLPLRDALDVFRTSFNIPIVLDEKAVVDVSIDPMTPVTVNFRAPDSQGTTVGEGLRRMLEQFHPPLRYDIRDGVLVITPSSAGAASPPAKPRKK